MEFDSTIEDEADGTCTLTPNVIPHRFEVTTLGALKVDDKVNLEIDVLARYPKRMQALAGWVNTKPVAEPGLRDR